MENNDEEKVPKIIEYPLSNHVIDFQGDKLAQFSIRTFENRQTKEICTFSVINILHSPVKFKPGYAPKAGEVPDNLIPAVALAFKSKDSILAMKSWLDKLYAKVEKFEESEHRKEQEKTAKIQAEKIGRHFCPDWDEMELIPGMIEFCVCSCVKEEMNAKSSENNSSE